MGVDDELSDVEGQGEELIREYFDRKLRPLGLAEDQIEAQSPDELHKSLAEVDNAISRPELFGKLKLQISPSGELIAVTKRKDAHIEIGILPLLLERKSLILSRTRTLIGKQKVSKLKELLGSIADPQLRANLESEVSSFEDQSANLTEQENKVSRAQAEQALAKRSVKLLERKLRAWTDFFNKESVAIYVGAFLVVILTFVQVAAMFANYHSETINSAFLLLLGYFFSQGVALATSGQRNQGTGG
jgi:hypothetical protein